MLTTSTIVNYNYTLTLYHLKSKAYHQRNLLPSKKNKSHNLRWDLTPAKHSEEKETNWTCFNSANKLIKKNKQGKMTHFETKPTQTARQQSRDWKNCWRDCRKIIRSWKTYWKKARKQLRLGIWIGTVGTIINLAFQSTQPNKKTIIDSF